MNKVMQTSSNQFDISIIESVIINGDLSKLSPAQKIQYYKYYCEKIGLDYTSQPFDLLNLKGKQVLYCTRSGAQQLNQLHKVSHEITNREFITAAGIYQVTARASLPDGRHTDSIGAVDVSGLKGEAYANAIMKAETKAKRRSTLDLLGLGILDETETSSIPDATVGGLNDIPDEHDREILRALLYNSDLTDQEQDKAMEIINTLSDFTKYNKTRDRLQSRQKPVDSKGAVNHNTKQKV